MISRIDNAISSLDSASSWGWFDLFGGEFFSSLIKREKIRDANRHIDDISESLHRFNKELEDVDMHLPVGISDTLSDNAFDVWFDNIFTDIRVQGEIKEQLNELREFRGAIAELIQRLNSEIKGYEDK